MPEPRVPIEHVAKLARIALTPDEIELYGRQLEQILEYFQQLGEIDTSGVEPTTHVLPVENVTRPDEAQPSTSPDRVIENAPDAREGFFSVPRVLDE